MMLLGPAAHESRILLHQCGLGYRTELQDGQ
jgi:hypothetical protein